MTKICLIAALLFSTGCGLISSDVTNFDLTLPAKNFSVDAASWEIDDAEAQPLLQTQAACPMNCDGECNASTQTCDLSLGISLYQMVDLINEKPELQSINDEPVIKVTVDSVEWEVTANTLNTATPPMEVFVAPMSVMDPSSPDARLIGTISGIEPGEVTDAPRQIEFTATGKAELVAAMSTFKVPFNMIVGSTITVTAGQSVPTGRLDAVVLVKAHAGL
jgi:hypothetical protein